MPADKTFQLLERFAFHGFYTIASKYQEQFAILPISVNMTVLRIVMIVRISESRNRKNPRFLRFSGQVGTRLKGLTETKILRMCYQSKFEYLLLALHESYLPAVFCFVLLGN